MLNSHPRSTVVVIGLLLAVAACGGGASGPTSLPPQDQPDPATAPSTAPTTTSPETTLAPQEMISVFFDVGDGSVCDQVKGFERQVASSDPIAAAFGELVKGPTPDEAAAGASSFFSGETVDAIRSVSLNDGLLAVDFNDVRSTLSNASTSCGSAALLASLNATALQFPEVERVRYSISGNCSTFYEWLQSECEDQTRSGPVSVDLSTTDMARGSGCAPDGDTLGDGEWFGYVDDAGVTEIDFDVACWFSGEAATQAAAEDGAESPPPNDYHIRNASDQLYTVAAGQGLIVQQLGPTGGPETEKVPFDEWSAGWATRDWHPGVWVTVQGGEIVSIVEQYQP